MIIGPWRLRAGGVFLDAGSHRCFEELGLAKDGSGPYDYETDLPPIELAGRRALLRFGAVSYASVIMIDGREVGRHRGAWDAFELDITEAVADGTGHRLTVTVEKPASLTAGPDSAAVAGRYPTREVLAGFLPYVWGHLHGGIWQPVELILAEPVRVADLELTGEADGRVRLALTLTASGSGTVRILDPDGQPVAEDGFVADPGAAIRLKVPSPRPWSPADPARYTAEVALDGGATQRRRFGLRTVATGHDPRAPHLIRLNGDPVFLRQALSWGWYPDLLAPDPGPERVRRDLLRLRELGYNGVKLCLWFPPDYYFDLADELGLLLWVELPLWLPRPSPGFEDQLQAESLALVRQARRHPSVISYTLGCELGAAVGADLLGRLYRRVKAEVGDALVCDNSGSGEAYGGATEAHADFYDHHLYAELEHLAEIFDHFAPRWRVPLPWLLGEFCDLDVYRDPRRLDEAWWASKDPAVNPQGARWQYDVPDLADRLRAGGWWDRGTELERLGRHAALLHRKVTCEYVRSRPDTSGYVITGERDTPISTAGMIDDHDQLRVDPAAFAAFNADTVILLAPERRRRWVAGGDRPAPLDPWCHPAGGTVRMRLLIAHHGPGRLAPEVDWKLRSADDERCLGSGRISGPTVGAGVHEVGALEVSVPERIGPVRLDVRDARAKIINSWTWWIVPADPWHELGPIAVTDPAGRFDDLADLAEIHPTAPAPGVPWLTTRWSPDLERFLEAGGHAVLALDRASGGPVPVAAMPFWRESVKIIEPHPRWRDFPHRGVVDLQFFGCATELAMDLTGLPGTEPLLRRLDARTGVTHDYAALLRRGPGTALLTTLAFEGGRGSQPPGLRRNLGAAALLATWLRTSA